MSVMLIWLCVVTFTLLISLFPHQNFVILSPPQRAVCHTRSALLIILISVTNRTACLLWYTPWDSPVLQTDPASVVSRHGGSCDDISVSATRWTVTSLQAAGIIDLCNVRTVCQPLTCCSPAERRSNRVQRYLTEMHRAQLRDGPESCVEHGDHVEVYAVHEQHWLFYDNFFCLFTLEWYGMWGG